jgi:hypothetical protein
MMPIINDPAICAEIAALHDAYEAALAANDATALVGYFWSSPHVVRFGVAEHLYGAEEISAYRQNQKVVFSNRKMLRRTIVAVGTDTVSVMCEISQTVFGQPRHSRQSQVWVRFPEVGWKIIAAHVSNALVATSGSWDTYADQAAVAVGLPLAAAHRPGVVGNLSRMAAVAGPLLDFPLPDVPEPASVFTA